MRDLRSYVRAWVKLNAPTLTTTLVNDNRKTKVTNLQLTVQSVPITTKVLSSNPVHDEVYSIQHYVITFVSDLRQVGVFLRFPPPIKLTSTIIEMLL